MPYTSQKPPLSETSDQLRARIPGWGVDLDPNDRPSVPKEQFDPSGTGAHWDFPERQPEKWPRERSLEHKFLTPVFGTSCPPKGLSGGMRKLAYRRYSEGQAAHWLMLIAADRVDAAESHLRSLATLHPDNPITETGVMTEFHRHGIDSRISRHRADVVHQTMDSVIVAGPWLLAGCAVFLTVRSLIRSARSKLSNDARRRRRTRYRRHDRRLDASEPDRQPVHSHRSVPEQGQRCSITAQANERASWTPTCRFG